MKKNLLTLIFVGLIVGNASAVNLYWDPDASTTVPGNNDVSNGSNLGGAGTWNAANLNWWDGGAGVPGDGTEVAWGTSTTNSATFWGTAGLVTIPTGATGEIRTATGLNFKTDGYELTGAGTNGTTRGVITFSVAPNIVVDPNVKATISAKIGAASYALGYNVSGGGTLKIAEPSGVTAAAPGGANATLGTVSVTSGTAVNATNFSDGNHTILEVIGGGQIGSSGTVGQYPITLNGGTYRDTDTTPTGTAFQFTTGTSRNWVIGANGGVWDVPSSAAILLNGGATVGAGSVVGGGGTVLYKTGPGEIRMAGVAGQTNTVEKLVIAEGRFTVGQAVTLGRDDQLGAVPVSQAAGAQAVTLNGQNSGAILRFAGGTNLTTVTTNVNRGIYLDNTGGGTNTLQVGDTNAAIPGLISGPGGFIKTGGLILTLSKTDGNTYAGTTTVTGGILKLMSTNTSTGSRVSGGLVTVKTGAALSAEYDSTIGGNSPQPEAPGGVTIESGGNLAGNGIISGTISLAAGAKISPGIGGGNAQLQVPNADFSGGSPLGGILQSTLGAGTSSDVLKVTNVNGLNLNGGAITLTPLATANAAGQTYTLIDYNTSFTGTVGSMKLNDLTGFDGTTLFDDSANHRIKVTVGTQGIDRTWIRETDFGLWNIDAPPGPNESANWAKADNTTPAAAANGVGAIARFPATVPAGLPDAGNAIPGQSVLISDANKTLGTLVLDNPNTWTFGGGIAGLRLNMQTYTGNALIDVKQGTHTFTNLGVTLTSPTNINLANGTALTFSVNATSNAAGLTVNTAGTSTFTTAPITNNGGFTKTGPGTVVIFTNDWTGTGATNINEGTLRYTSDNAPGLSNSSTVTVAGGATLDFNSGGAQITGIGGAPGANGVGDTIGALAGAGTLLNNRNLTLNGTNGSPVVFSGTIGISSALGGNDFFSQDPTHQAIVRAFVKTGSGSQTIGGTLEATGNYTVGTLSGGTLILNNTAGSLTTSTGTMTLSVAGTTLGGTGTLLGPVTMASGTILAPGSGGIGTIHLKGATALTLPAGSLMSFDIGTGGADMIDAATSAVSIATSTTTKINLVQSGTITPGTYTLIDYNTLTGTGGFAGLSLGTQPAGFSYTLFNDATAGVTAVKLTIASLTIPGDANNDGKVDASDYVLIRKSNPDITTGAGLTAYNTWRTNYGTGVPGAGSGGGLDSSAVPEPTALLLAVLGVFFTGMVRRRR